MAKIGLRMPVFRPGNYPTDGSATTYDGPGFVMGKAVSCNLTLTRSDAKLDADDTVAETDYSITSASIDLTLDDMSEEHAVKVFGYDADGTDGYTVKDSASPYGSFGYIRKRVQNGVASYLVYWYYKTAFAQNGENAETMASSGASFQTYDCTGSMMRAAEGFYNVKAYAEESAAVNALKTLTGITGAA